MKYRTFGKTGWQVSEIGFGAWAIGGFWGEYQDEVSLKALQKAFECELNFIDTAHVYGDGHSEELIGKALLDANRNQPSHPVRVATKIPPTEGNWPPFPDDICEERYPREYIRKGVETSLKRLGVEVIDLMQLHTWTRAWNENPVCLQYLEELKQEGKILAYGISTPEQDQNSLIDLMKQGLIDSVQVIYNLFDQEAAAEFLTVAKNTNTGVIVRCALDEGSLAGKWEPDHEFEKDDFRRMFFKGGRFKETLRRVALIRNSLGNYTEADPDNMASLAVRFVLQHPAVSTVITGIRTPEQVERNGNIVNDPPLSPELYQDLKKHNWRRYFWEWSEKY